MFPKAILSFLAIIFALVSTDANASVQRMALPPQTIIVGGGAGGSVPVDRAYCIDEHRATPTNSSSMASVVGGNGTAATVTHVQSNTRLPLQEALSQGWVRFSGTGEATGLMLTSESGEEYKVEISKAVALSEDANEFSEDIETTLAWIDEEAEGSDLADWEANPTANLWERRASAAEGALANDLAFVDRLTDDVAPEEAQLFTLFVGEDDARALIRRKSLQQAWEYRLRVQESGQSLALYGHLEGPGDAWERFAMKAGEPTRFFSGADADRQVIEFFSDLSPGTTIEIVRPDRLEQLGAISDQIALAETAFEQAELGSAEEAAAFAMQVRLYELLIRSAQLSLLMADPGSWNGNSTFVVSSDLPPDLGLQTLGVRSGVIAAIDGVGSFSGEPTLPSILAAPYLSDQQPARITAYAQQGDAKWTLVAQSSQHRLPRLREIASDASAAMFNAVAADANEEAVVKDVEDVVKFNSLALEGLPTSDEIPAGEEIEVLLFLDDEQRLNMRLAVQIIEGNRRLAIASFDDIAR